MASGTNWTPDNHPKGVCYYLVPENRTDLREPRITKTLRHCTRRLLLPLSIIAILSFFFIILKADRPFVAKAKVLLALSAIIGLSGVKVLGRHYLAYRSYENNESTRIAN